MLAANLETAINGVWDAHPQVGDRVVVIGAGTVGSLVAWDCEPDSRMPGRARGHQTRSGRRWRLHSATLFFSGRRARGADVVIHASASAAGLELALGVAGFEATIARDELGTAISPSRWHWPRLPRATSDDQVVAGCSRAAPQRSRWDLRRRMQFALASLADPALDALITGRPRSELIASGDASTG